MLQGLMLTSRRNERRLVEAIARLRKRAGKVRDLDVLAGLVCMLRASGENECRIQLLEHLGALRFRRARKLYNLVQIDGPVMQRRLKRCLRHIDQALENRDTSLYAVTLSRRLSAELASPPRLDASNLHDYRKKVKELYYLLQFLNHSSAHFAETLGRVKDAIGEWHDWEELAAIADRLLDHHPACNLVEEIQSIRQAKFEHALAIANEMRTKYLSGTLKPRSYRHRRQRQSGTELGQARAGCTFCSRVLVARTMRRGHGEEEDQSAAEFTTVGKQRHHRHGGVETSIGATRAAV